MKQCSPSFVVYKWKDQTFQSAITSKNNITANQFQMKIFFDNLKPRAEAGNIWCNITAGHDKSSKLIKEIIDWWFQMQDCGMC